MARIRTIKPELFRHQGLFDLELETALPIRLSWAGLFTCSDREGRFKWRPRELKLDVLPYDELDFSRVLDALLTRGYLVKYRCGTEWYGEIPSWDRHQHVNPREHPSELPSPEDCDEVIDSSATGEARVRHASGTRQAQSEDASGTRASRCVPPHNSSDTNITPPKEGEGEGERSVKAHRANGAQRADAYTPVFEASWGTRVRRSGADSKLAAWRAWRARMDEGVTQEAMAAGMARYRSWCDATGKTGSEYVKQTCVFLGRDRHFEQESWDNVKPKDKPKDTGWNIGVYK